MVVLRNIRDADVEFHPNGRIQIRNHPTGSYKGIIILKRDSCPFCVKSLQAAKRLASRHSSMHPIYVVDIQDPTAALIVERYKPQAVPFFVKVNKLGRADNREFDVDWSNETSFLSAIRRET